MPNRKICIITGTRAEYGLLYWLMREVQEDPELHLQIIATGMHLSPEFGLTYQEIENDGFYIDEKVEMLLSSDTPTGIAKSIGLGVIGFADSLERLQPDIIVILGDRYEILAAAQASLVANIPIAHIHGGELTEGAIDEAIRHSLTKMAHMHFTATEPYRKRVIQLGEQPDRVINVGAPGLDSIDRLTLLDRQELEQALDFQLCTLNFLVTYHPVTLKKGETKQTVEELLAALDYFPEAKVIFTKSNSDADGRIINQLLEEYASKNLDRVKLFTSMGQLRYLSAIKHVHMVIGNSSSGIIEVPVFKKPTVNIGNRQRGRLKTTSIINSNETKEDIIHAIQKGLSLEFQHQLNKTKSIYGDGNTSKKIKNRLKAIKLEGIMMKSFYDLEVNIEDR